MNFVTVLYNEKKLILNILRVTDKLERSSLLILIENSLKDRIS